MSHTTQVKTVPIKDIPALKKAIEELRKEGVNITLEENAIPRMYYQDQLQKHMGLKSDVCDYVIRVQDSYFDIGLVKDDAAGGYTPVFDDYGSPGPNPLSRKGRGAIKQFLGASFAGKAEHWSGRRDDTEQTLHSIGKLMQGYTKHAAINAAVKAGHNVLGTTKDKNGNIQLRLGVK